MEHYVVLPDGTQVPALGQGTWFLGEQKADELREQEALTAGISAGMTVSYTHLDVYKRQELSPMFLS